MHIFFTRFPFESANGGAENQTMWLADGLRSRGHAVKFLGSCPVLLSRFREAKIPTAQLSIGLPPVSAWTALTFLWRRISMKQKLIAAIEAEQRKPDIIVMMSLSEKILLTRWAADHGMKVLWVEHDRIGCWLRKNPWLRSLRRASTRATVVCVSELSRQLMLKIGFNEKNVIAIPNGIPLPTDISSHVGGEQLHIGCVARLSREKGVDVLVRALAEIAEADLSVIGSGPEEGYVRSLIREDEQRIGMRRMRLHAHVRDLETFYAGLDIFVLPSSDHDPFGLVAAEAMARGIATVVTTACGIAASLEHGKDALIVEAGSESDMESAIRSLLDAATRERIAAEGLITARTCFSLERMTDAYEEAMQ